LELMPRFWIPKSSKLLKLAFLANRFAAHVGTKSAP
jgi:hypothetical protein